MTTHTVTHAIDLCHYEDAIRAHWYRWECSCGRRGGWQRKARSARIGGQRHVAAMERGHDPFAVLRQPGKGGARTTEGRERVVAKFERRAAIARGVMRRAR